MTCPFCKTELPEGATVCAGCGARKGINGEQGNPFIRFAFWMCGPGGVLVVWLGIIPAQLWQLLAKGIPDSRTLAQAWGGVHRSFYTDVVNYHDWKLLGMLLAGFVLGYPILKITNKIWVWLFGRFTDPVWYR